MRFHLWLMLLLLQKNKYSNRIKFSHDKMEEIYYLCARYGYMQYILKEAIKINGLLQNSWKTFRNLNFHLITV